MDAGPPNPGAGAESSSAFVLGLVAGNDSVQRNWEFKETLKALRLTCKTTQLAVDQRIKELRLTDKSAKGLRPVGNALTAGLTSLHFSRNLGHSSMLNELAIALRNSTNIESLSSGFDSGKPSNVPKTRGALAILGNSPWPKLRSLTINALPSIFTDYINIDSLPNLAELKLHGEVSGADVIALSRGRHFPSKVEILSFNPSLENDGPDVITGLTDLLGAASRLRYLKLSVSCSLDFFPAAEMPSLEHLELYIRRDNVSLDPITAIPRPRLQSLRLSGGTASVAFGWPGSLPALEKLEFLSIQDWSFLREFSHTTLKALIFEECSCGADDIAHIATAVARLPALEELHMLLLNTTGENFDAEASMRLLLSGPVLSCLRILVTANSWKDNDASLKCLIDHADKLPQLEEIGMAHGRISPAGLIKLAAAGGAGCWPRLKYFSIHDIDHELNVIPEDFISDCRCVVEQAWPGLEVYVNVEDSLGD